MQSTVSPINKIQWLLNQKYNRISIKIGLTTPTKDWDD